MTYKNLKSMKRVIIFIIVFTTSFNIFSQKQNANGVTNIGAFHNSGLDFMIEKISFETVNSFYSDKGFDSVGLVNYLLPFYNQFVSSNSFSVNGVQYMANQIQSPREFFNTPILNNPFAECSSADPDAIKLKECVTNIMRSDVNNIQLQVTGDIYLSSIDYWSTFNSPKCPTSKKWWQWALVANSDLQGGIGGFSLGGPAGAAACGLMMSSYSLCVQAMFQAISNH